MAGTETTVLKGIHDPSSQSSLHLEADGTLQISSIDQVRLKMNGDILLHEDPDPPAPADSEARSKVVVPQIGVWEFECEAGCIQWFGYVWKNIKSGLMITPKPPMNYSHNQDNQGRWPDSCSSIKISSPISRPCLPSDESGASEEFRRLVNNARFPLLDDEELIAERGRPLPKDYGGGIRLTDKQSDDKVIGQTGIASRGFSTSTTGSTTPFQKKSNLMQSNVGATSEEVPNNDSLASCDHLLTDHPNQEKKTGTLFSWFRKGGKKTTKQK